MASIKERATLLKECSEDLAYRQIVMEKCRRDPIFWFNYFCYTFDPRLLDAHLPFNLYPYQETTINVLVDCINRGEGLLMEKSRDMGATWMVMLVFQWFWIFREGSDFLVGAKKEADVDKRGNKSTLIQKIRYNLEYTPEWMMPILGKSNDTHMKLINPLNGNTIVGDTTTADFGRSHRFKAVFMDELSVQPYGKQAYESVQHSTNCILSAWTPDGKANIAFELRDNTGVEWIEIAA